MVQAASRAHDRALPRWFVQATASLVGAAALLAAIPSAEAQLTRAAAIGVFRNATSTFALDGDFDNIADALIPYGQAGDVALLADITGSGAPTPVVYRNYTFIFDLDRNGVVDKTVTWGSPGTVPLVADMDGDGKDDLVLFYSGQWYVNTRADGTVQWFYQFGGSRGDVPVLADFNGDGVVDLGIYNRGSWHVSFNRQNNIQASYSHGGATGDVPIAFDYDGDGKAELAVVNNGVWNVKSTTGGTASFTFGAAGDTPLYFGRGAVYDPRRDAARFLNHVTFGPTAADITRVQQIGYTAFVDEQLAMAHTPMQYIAWWPQTRPQTPMGQTWPLCQYSFYGFGGEYNSATPCNCVNLAGTANQCQRDMYSNFIAQNEMLKRAIGAPDQLRHRVAWALSQILVTSSLQDPIAYPMRNYQQLLHDSAFSRFEDLLYNITISPWMGNYLDMVRNNGSPAAIAAGIVPNENYARELLQLFSIGLWELNADGSLILDAQSNPVPTYDQDEIVALSRALTGWAYPARPGQTQTFGTGINYIGSMVAIEGPLSGHGSTNYHDVGAKTVMGFTQPPGTRAEPDVRWAVQLAANHPNTGVFIGKQLIQHLVTGNPSPAFVNRVTAAWNNNGQGVRGDLRHVVRSIVLDYEGLAPQNPVMSTYGKLKEPVLLVTSMLRALGGYSDGVALRAPLTSMGQNVYNAPTVFNYYQADFVIPNTDLAGPPFQIFDATSYFARVNSLYNIAYQASCDTGQPTSPSVCGSNADPTVFNSVGTKINWQPLKNYALDPAALVDNASMMLLNTPLPKAQRAQIINAVAAVTLSATPTQLQLLDRVRMAVYLISISPKFQVES